VFANDTALMMLVLLVTSVMFCSLWLADDDCSVFMSGMTAVCCIEHIYFMLSIYIDTTYHCLPSTSSFMLCNCLMVHLTTKAFQGVCYLVNTVYLTSGCMLHYDHIVEQYDLCPCP